MNDGVTTLAGEPETIEALGIAFPAIAALADAREKYWQVNTELSALEDKLTRLQRDETEALNEASSSTDEEGGYARLGEIRLRVEVFGKRVSHKRLDVSRLLGEFEERYKPAELELSAAQSIELTRRQEILSERVMGVLGLTSEDWEAESYVSRAVAVSPFLTALRACSPNQNAFSTISIEQKANELLGLAAKLAAEIGRSI
jgi:hypothetical protein